MEIRLTREELEREAFDKADLSMEYIGEEAELMEEIKEATDEELMQYITEE